MFDVVVQMLLQFVEILKVFIPMYLIFDIVGDLLFRDR